MKIVDLDCIKLEKNDINLIGDFELKIVEYLNSGSYGKVYVCLLNDKRCVLKISNNEDPHLLKKRYKELKDKIEGKIIKIYCCGKISNDKEYKYYCIMKYGGSNIKSFINNNGIDIKFIINKMYEIVEIIRKHKILIPDFKLSNLTLYKKELFLIDYFMECESYSPCRECKIIRTYSTYDLSTGKMYEKDYNYTYIYVLFAFCLIELLCTKSLNSIHKSLKKKYTDVEYKKFFMVVQLSSCKCLGYNERNINYDDNLDKNILSSYYNHFLELIDIRDEYKNIITTEKFKILLNNTLIPIPSERKIDSNIFK